MRFFKKQKRIPENPVDAVKYWHKKRHVAAQSKKTAEAALNMLYQKHLLSVLATLQERTRNNSIGFEFIEILDLAKQKYNDICVTIAVKAPWGDQGNWDDPRWELFDSLVKPVLTELGWHNVGAQGGASPYYPGFLFSLNPGLSGDAGSMVTNPFMKAILESDLPWQERDR